MRDYKAKMQMYRLSSIRYAELRRFCLNANRNDLICIEAALSETVKDELATWLYKHVVSTDWTWAKMESEGLPCNRDTFRVYRAKFYYNLDRILTGRLC